LPARSPPGLNSGTDCAGCRLSSCVNQERATFTGPSSPNPRAGAVCYGGQCPLGIYWRQQGYIPLSVTAFCSSWAGQLEVIGTGRQLCTPWWPTLFPLRNATRGFALASAGAAIDPQRASAASVGEARKGCPRVGPRCLLALDQAAPLQAP